MVGGNFQRDLEFFLVFLQHVHSCHFLTGNIFIYISILSYIKCMFIYYEIMFLSVFYSCQRSKNISF